MHRGSRGRTPCVRALVDEVGLDTDVDGGVDGGVDEVGVDTNGDGGVDTNVDGGVDGVFAGATAPRLASRPAALTPW